MDVTLLFDAGAGVWRSANAIVRAWRDVLAVKANSHAQTIKKRRVLRSNSGVPVHAASGQGLTQMAAFQIIHLQFIEINPNRWTNGILSHINFTTEIIY